MNDTGSYYVHNKEKLLKGIAGSILTGHVPPVLEHGYGKETAEQVMKGTGKKFDSYAAALPYGGDEDMHDAKDLIFAAWCLAYYRTMRESGRSAEEAGRALYDATVEKMNAYPPFLMKLLGWILFTPVFKRINRRTQEATHGRKCKYCFVSNYVEGDGIRFDYGKDYIQCGINTYFREQGAEEFLPYMCCLDYPLARPIGIGFHRTTTLGTGGDRCDFRYKKGRETESGWPPKGA